MSSQYMFISQTFSPKLCARKTRFSSTSCSAKNFLPFPIFHKSSSSQSFQIDLRNSNQSNQKNFKHHTRASKDESERDEKEDDDDGEEDFQKEDHKDIDFREEGNDKDIDFREEDNDKQDFGKDDDYKEVFGEEDDDKEAEDNDKEVLRAEETVLQLYTDIKNRNIDGISEVIGDECQCFSNFFSTYRLLQGKKQVMAFFYWLMMKLGKDIKIIVKPTSKDGMTIGVQWQLEWEKPHIQLGKGFSFHICHVYQGKLLIKNVEMFMEPIFHMEHLRLGTIAFAVRLAENMINCLRRPAKNIKRQAMSFLLLALLLLAAAAFYFTTQRF